MNYYSYIQSPAWRARANDAKQQAGYRCQVCNRSSSEVTLDAHHRTYDRLFNERPDDITVLCRDCHELYESQKRLPKPPHRLTSSISHKNSDYAQVASIVPRGETSLATVSAATPPAILQLEYPVVETNNAEGYYDWDDDSLPKHMLVWLGRFVHFFGYGANGLLLLAIYWGLILESPINLVNPLVYILVPFQVLTSWLFWQFSGIALAGFVLTVVGVWLVRAIRPRTSVLRWYWRRKPALLVTVPLFLIAFATGAYATWGLIFTIIQVFVGGTPPSILLFGSNLLRIYTALLPLPVLHLIWDNRFRQTWAKLAITIVVMPALLFASLVVELWWGAEMCEDGIGEASMCQFYSTTPQWLTVLTRSTRESSTALPIPTQSVAITPAPVPVETSQWTEFNSKAGPLALAYPSDWSVLRDEEGAIELQGNNIGLGLLLTPGAVGGEIAATIERSTQDSNFAENYNQPLRDYLGGQFDKHGGGLVSFGNPVIETVGNYSTISNGVVFYETFSGVRFDRRMWLYFLDCGSHVCQVLYTKNDSSAFTKEQQQIAERIIASIKVDTSASDTAVAPPNPPPVSTQKESTPDLFSGLSFCYAREFSELSQRCSQNHTIFTGTVEKLYVSWQPSSKYKGATFLKKWYIDGKHFLDSESTNEYGFLEIETRTSLKPGKYRVDLYVADTLVAHGTFEIR